MSDFDLQPREPVVLVEDFGRLVAWYRDVLGFRVRRTFEDGMHYANLETESGIELGIALASEVQTEPGDRAGATVILQFEVHDVRGLLNHVATKGGTVTFGPHFNEQDGFWFGAFADPEGNRSWVVDGACPS